MGHEPAMPENLLSSLQVIAIDCVTVFSVDASAKSTEASLALQVFREP